MTLPNCYRCSRQPCECSDGITLYHADCRDVLPELPKVDLVLTDPPYGVGFRGEGWDAEIPQVATELPGMFPACVIITAPTMMWDYPRPDWVNCWYRPAAQSRAASGGFNHWTPILVYGKIKWPVDTKHLNALQNRRAVGCTHPCPKPDALMSWLCKYASDSGETILDPFTGSGTTLRAAKDLGRKAIGIEIEEKYCKIAAERLRQEVLF